MTSIFLVSFFLRNVFLIELLLTRIWNTLLLILLFLRSRWLGRLLTYLGWFAYDFWLVYRSYTPVTILRAGELPRTTFHHSSNFFNICDRFSAMWARVIAVLDPSLYALIMEIMAWVTLQDSELWVSLEWAHTNCAIVIMLVWIEIHSCEGWNNSLNLISSQSVFITFSIREEA